MLTPSFFIETLNKNNIDFFTGVPDSLLKDFCAYLKENCPDKNNIIAANEGAAVALASGYYLATQKIPVVYMQNSGMGNAVNPLLSLCDREVYNIPLILLIGWRGEPNVHDEPQHVKQGKTTVPLLDVMGIKHKILSTQEDEFVRQLNEALFHIESTKEPVAFIVRKGTFDDYKLQDEDIRFSMTRETAIKTVAASVSDTDIVVSTTGMISRELFEYREETGQRHERDFLTVGSMGHASQIALGIALQTGERKVYCFDGDGAILMHMGAMAITGSMKPANYVHVVFNNGAHDSVGGQPTAGLEINLPQIALSCGYSHAFSIEDESVLKKRMKEINNLTGPVFVEVKVAKGYRKNLGRPTTAPVQNKEALMIFLEN